MYRAPHQPDKDNTLALPCWPPGRCLQSKPLLCSCSALSVKSEVSVCCLARRVCRELAELTELAERRAFGSRGDTEQVNQARRTLRQSHRLVPRAAGQVLLGWGGGWGAYVLRWRTEWWRNNALQSLALDHLMGHQPSVEANGAWRLRSAEQRLSAAHSLSIPRHLGLLKALGVCKEGGI